MSGHEDCGNPQCPFCDGRPAEPVGCEACSFAPGGCSFCSGRSAIETLRSGSHDVMDASPILAQLTEQAAVRAAADPDTTETPDP